MKPMVEDELERAIRDLDEGWLIDDFVPPVAAMQHLGLLLSQVEELARLRDEVHLAFPSAEALLKRCATNPSRVKAFFQCLGGKKSPEILLMVWRVLEGWLMTDVQVSYRARDHFEVSVVLESPEGATSPPYRSSNVFDFDVFRHVLLMEVDGRPQFDGFAPLRIR
jgi:hypothetical protein